MAERFLAPRRAVACRPILQGHIHQTWKVEADPGPPLLLQQISVLIFGDPPGLIRNHRKIAERVRELPGPPEWRVPEPWAAPDGDHLIPDADFRVWRAMTWLDGMSHDTPASPEHVHAAARAFGEFARAMNLPGRVDVRETIRGFRDSPRRIRRLQKVAAEDARGRLDGCSAELEGLLAFKDDCEDLHWHWRNTSLPRRIVHNDTKLNNLLADPENPCRILGIVDLDTVMEGLLAYDYGDFVRTIASATAEDEPDPARVEARPDWIAAATEGYREGCGDLLTAGERESLRLGAVAITAETGIRFLTDHLAGDVYFKVAYPGHNLVRARTQLALARQLAGRGNE